MRNWCFHAGTVAVAGASPHPWLLLGPGSSVPIQGKGSGKAWGHGQPWGWHPVPCGRWVPGNKQLGFLESLPSRPSQVPRFAPAYPEPSAPHPALLLVPRGRGWCQPHAAPTTQGSCLSPSFIYFLENFLNILILLLVSPLNSIFCPCAPTHLIG